MEAFECGKCLRKFTQKSSLVRHAKRCLRNESLSATRQKSCKLCVSAKTRCDLVRPTCTRCSLRGAVCEYATAPTPPHVQHTTTPQAESDSHLPLLGGLNGPLFSSQESCESIGLPTPAPTSYFSLEQETYPLPPPSSGPTNSIHEGQTNIPTELPAFRNPHDILNASLESLPSLSSLSSPNTMAPGANAKEKSTKMGHDTLSESLLTSIIAKNSTDLLFRVMRTWPTMIAKEFQVPPFIHHIHGEPARMASPLANCFIITKMWNAQSLKKSSLVKDTVLKEMGLIVDKCYEMSEPDLLAALQALVVYTLILLFPTKSQDTICLLDASFFPQIEQVLSQVGARGLILKEEFDHTRPSWESWIHASSKRRTAIALYLIHWAYCSYHTLPFPVLDSSDLMIFPGTEPKYLWQAPTRKQWEFLYNKWLAQWGDSPFRVWEYGAIERGIGLPSRAQIWLEDADEFGIMILSILGSFGKSQDEEELVHI